jgi:hypothetical protein
MKNLHLLQTNKPSRLWINTINGELVLDKETNELHAQNIYITCDEEIKEGVDQWYLDKVLNEPYNSGGAQYSSKQDVIILTTDQDLIKDGVQAIPDEFLEWFVKNPSCESVEVESNKCLVKRGQCSCSYQDIDCQCLGYKIIIPKEELNLNCFDCNKSLQDCTCMEDTIDMTDPLEQTAKEYSERHLDVSGNLGKYLVKAVFQDGVKWKQEQDKNKYSEEEVISLLNDFAQHLIFNKNSSLNIIEWFKENKKK